MKRDEPWTRGPTRPAWDYPFHNHRTMAEMGRDDPSNGDHPAAGSGLNHGPVR